jgi:hypothetical protein
MQPTPAEVARTLAHNRVPAAVHIACRPGPRTAHQTTDCAGRPLLLVRESDPIATALRPRSGARDVAVAVCVEDRAPVPGAPAAGRVWVSGWAAPITGDTRERTAAIEFAEANPHDDLLDIGRGVALYRVEVREVRLEADQVIRSIDPEEYIAADPDPLRDTESDLLLDLIGHHGTRMRPYLTRRLAQAGLAAQPGRRPRPVRVDRYGFVVAAYADHDDLGDTFVRVPFPRPVRDRLDLARLLHPVLFPHPGHSTHDCQTHQH